MSPARRPPPSPRRRPDVGPDAWDLRAEAPPRRDPVTKERVRDQRTERFRGTPAAARKAQAAFAARVQSEEPREGQPVTLAQAVEKWLRHCASKGLEVNTMRNYRQRGAIVKAELGDITLDELEPEHIEDFYASLTEKGRAPKTVAHYHEVIRSTLNHAMKRPWGRQWLKYNPAAGAARPAVRNPELVIPTPDQVNGILASAEKLGRQLSTFMRLAAATWARRGEVCGLRWPDVRLEDGEVLIQTSIVSLVNGTRGARAAKDTKSHAKRLVTIDPDTIDLLTDYRDWLDKQAAEAGVTVRDDGYLFSDDLDGANPWHPDRGTDGFERACKLAKVEGVRLHDLRHFGATQALANNVPITTVSHRLGHSKVTTTLDLYAHWIPATDHLASALMGQLLKRPLELTAA